MGGTPVGVDLLHEQPETGREIVLPPHLISFDDELCLRAKELRSCMLVN